MIVERGTGSVEVPLELATRCRTTALATEGQPTLYTAELPGRQTVQLYADPGKGGLNEIHATYFDVQGNELPIAGDVVMRASGGGDPIALAVRRFGPGHFIGDARLEAGPWRFDVSAPGPEGRPLRACFEERLPG